LEQSAGNFPQAGLAPIRAAAAMIEPNSDEQRHD
jgi:hypothetical protein